MKQSKVNELLAPKETRISQDTFEAGCYEARVSDAT